MKYYPTIYKHTANYYSPAQLEGVNLHQDYEVTTVQKGRISNLKVTSRIFIAERPPYKVGDVVVGNLTELSGLFGSRLTLNQYTRYAIRKDAVAPVSTVSKPTEDLIEITDSLNPVIQSLQSCSTYKGVDIVFKPVVNNVIFESVEEAEKAIDIALALKL